MKERTYLNTKCNKCYSTYYIAQISDDGKDWLGNQKKEPTIHIEEKPCPYCKHDAIKATAYLRKNIKHLVDELNLKLSNNKKYPVIIQFPNNNKQYIYYTNTRLEKGIYKNPFNNTLCELVSGNEESFFLLNKEQLNYWDKNSKKFCCKNVTKEIIEKEKSLITECIDKKDFSNFQEISKLISFLLNNDFKSYIKNKKDLN